MTSSPDPKNAGRRMVSVRLSAEAREILARLSERQGISQAAVLEIVLRDAARRAKLNKARS